MAPEVSQSVFDGGAIGLCRCTRQVGFKILHRLRKGAEFGVNEPAVTEFLSLIHI